MTEATRQSPIRAVTRTHEGLVRTNNEDAVDGAPEIGLLVLADGMGGYSAGEVAAEIAVRTIVEYTRSHWPAQPITVPPAGLRADSRVLQASVAEAHHAIREHAAREPECAGMGTTVVACLLRPDGLSVAHVGDSRMYRLRGDDLRQLTADHSLLEELIARGHYSRAEAEGLVRKNIVTRALGIDQAIEVDIAEHDTMAGDIVLLCSDGLTDMVEDAEIRETLIDANTTLEQSADRLVEQALQHGGRDNVTVALAQIDLQPPGTRPEGLIMRLKRLFSNESS